jgi:hypothetical protein
VNANVGMAMLQNIEEYSATVPIQRVFKNQGHIYFDAENFFLISKYTWYMVSIWYTPDLHVVTIDN